MSIVANLQQVKSDIPSNVKLVAVSKFHPEEEIEIAYTAGCRVFGESRMQELDRKQKNLSKDDIEWHFIGTLQTNKVKAIIPYVHTIHSVDSWKLLCEINKQALAAGRIVNCLLEIHVAKEDTKHGFSIEECRSLLTENDWEDLKAIQIIGIMSMATYTDDTSVIRSEFKTVKNFFNELKDSKFKEKDYFTEISMGMSNDYHIAIEEGATIVRIGSLIFGERK